MLAHRTEATVLEKGEIIIHNAPFQKGQRVEVITFLIPADSPPRNSYPLRGLKLRYDNPTDPVAESDWDFSQ